jgi:O-antigen ligase
VRDLRLEQPSSSVNAEATPLPAWLRAWLPSTLLLWVIGIQCGEGIATAGALGTALGVVLHVAREGAWPDRKWVMSWAPLLAFVAWGIFVTALRGQTPLTGSLARHLDWLLAPVAAAALSRIDGSARRALAVAAVGLLIVSGVAAGLQHYGMWPSEGFFESLRWTRIGFYRVYEPAPDVEGRFMAGGLLFHRLKFAHVSGLVVVAALVIGLRARGAPRLLFLGAATLGLGAIFLFTYTRAAFAAVLVAIAVALVLEKRSRRTALILGAVVVALAVGAVMSQPEFRARLLSSAGSKGSGQRAHLLAAGWSAVRAHPIAGTGIGGFKVGQLASADAPPEVRSHLGKSHNQFLTTAAETGIPGLVLWLLALGSLVRRMRPSEPLGAVGLSAMAFFLVLSLVHDPLFHAEVSLAFALTFGLAVGAADAGRSASTGNGAQRRLRKRPGRSEVIAPPSSTTLPFTTT